MAAKAYNWMVDHIKETLREDGKINLDSNESACLLGMRTRHYRVSYATDLLSSVMSLFVFQFQPVEELREESDFTYRRWKHIWWMNQRSIMNILAQHDSTYTADHPEEEF